MFDDRTAAGRDHRFDGGLHTQKRPGEVDVDDVLPVGKREILQRVAIDDAGIVDQHVEPAELAHCHLYGGLPLIGLDDVEVDGPGRRAQLLGERMGVVVENVADDDVGSFGDQCPRV
jgi:hypothetical protein